MSLWFCPSCKVVTAWNPSMTCNGCGKPLSIVTGIKPVAPAPAPSSRWWTAGWFALVLAFLAEEIPAAKGEGPGTTRTLSRHVWRWFPTWGWWSIVAAFMLALALHFSPLHFTVWPVIVIGAVIAARACWVEARRIADTTPYEPKGREYLCVDKEPLCWHRTWLGAWMHRRFREPNR